jgi:hypothetical protein
MTGATVVTVIALLLTSLVLERGDIDVSRDRSAGRAQLPGASSSAPSSPTAGTGTAAENPD